MKQKIIGMAMLLACVAVIFGQVNAQTTEDHNVTMDIGNIAPQIISVAKTYPAGNIVPVESSTTEVKWTLLVLDGNGASDITGATFRMTDPLAATRVVNCVDEGDINSTTVNMTCTVNVPYFFNYDGSKTSNATATDTAGVLAIDTSGAWDIDLLEALTIAPATITFGSLTSGATNQKATNDPMVLNNTGNAASLDVQVTGQTLYSGANSILVGNFSVGVADDCAGNQMTGAAVSITSASIPIHSDATKNTESTYYCIPLVPFVPIGFYTTTTLWTVTGFMP